MRRWLLHFCALFIACFASAQRLPQTATPENYQLSLAPNFTKDNFSALETIQVRVLKATSQIVLNSADIDLQEATISSAGDT
jgi:hypothetical protein